MGQPRARSFHQRQAEAFVQGGIDECAAGFQGELHLGIGNITWQEQLCIKFRLTGQKAPRVASTDIHADENQLCFTAFRPKLLHGLDQLEKTFANREGSDCHKRIAIYGEGRL